METETGSSGRSTAPHPAPAAAAAGTQRAQQGAAAAATRDDQCSVFISNLAYTLPEPEARLRSLFEACGPLLNVRPVFSNKGTFKGYGYVQFESAASVPEALKLDRREVEGRPMFVSPCVDKNRNPDFKVQLAGRGSESLVFSLGLSRSNKTRAKPSRSVAGPETQSVVVALCGLHPNLSP